ncbi:PREDICTED: uncharacterized protein LOC108971664 isoform X1 [Bactrocera latifrons]|uniref:uncharacterized protein LOC108971664 isoform X1 n=2 Tax=Bactrocera latifrons TaxID=174628 RepID=UPI0008DCE7F3|nr:PREDICTED: uncharacterized protein LOC108971664 isoform X1 [Bactrocera latifrons]
MYIAMKCAIGILALSIWFFKVCIAIKLKGLSLGMLSDNVPFHPQGIQQARPIWLQSMNPVSIPELMKVSTLTNGATSSKWPKKVNEVKKQLAGTILNQKVQMQTHKRLHNKLVSDSNTTGLLLLKTQLQYMPMLMASTTLPLEILASVRKNKTLLDQQKQRARHRHKNFITHTVVMKTANKQNKFRRGNDHKNLSQKLRRNRVRRELQEASNSKGEQRNKKQPSTSKLVDNANLIIRKGTLLLLHLDHLLKDADFFLRNKEDMINWNSNCNMKSSKMQKFPQNELKNLPSKTQEENERKRDCYILRVNCTKQPDRKADDRLLYEDVIANIRNMQHTQIIN